MMDRFSLESLLDTLGHRKQFLHPLAAKLLARRSGKMPNVVQGMTI